MGDITAPSRPRRRGHAHRRRLRHRHAAAVDHRPGRRPPAAEQRRRHALAGVQRRDLQLPRTAQPSCRRRATASRPASDSEVLLHGYAAWGDDVVLRLNGMFDFALWDARRRRLLIGRDRLGVKPLYVLQDGTRLAFATEAKALLALPGVQRRARPRGARRATCTWATSPRPDCIFKGIRKLPPATLLAVEDGQVREWRYWRLPRAHRPRGLRSAVGRARARAARAVGAHADGQRRADRRLPLRRRRFQRRRRLHGQALASSRSAPTPSASRAARPRRCTTSCPTRARWPSCFGTEHHEIVVKPDVVALLPRLLWHMDEPIVRHRPSSPPTWCRSSRARTSR